MQYNYDVLALLNLLDAEIRKSPARVVVYMSRETFMQLVGSAESSLIRVYGSNPMRTHNAEPIYGVMGRVLDCNVVESSGSPLGEFVIAPDVMDSPSYLEYHRPCRRDLTCHFDADGRIQNGSKPIPVKKPVKQPLTQVFFRRYGEWDLVAPEWHFHLLPMEVLGTSYGSKHLTYSLRIETTLTPPSFRGIDRIAIVRQGELVKIMAIMVSNFCEPVGEPLATSDAILLSYTAHLELLGTYDWKEFVLKGLDGLGEGT